ncbi:actinodin1 [Micropterus dolomieu]|uniref:actinodin1 n=1 Tax=Micropterus dolomieu TaxID=147949 RepID=UPI001E8D204D|nr:actinodin1 [Micropterus dolomieu]
MAERRRTSFSGVFITTLLAVMLLPAFLSAGPIVQKPKGDAGESIQERAAAAESYRRLIRNRRNISWYNQHSDFWGWYKYFTDNSNQEAIQEMDRIYLAYLQNKNRAEGRRSYKAYLRHLGEIYKSCSDSDDPNCVASHTSRPKPEPPKPALLKTCDPTKDSYCLYAALVQGKSPYLPLALPVATPAPAPVKAPAPLYVRSAAPAKDPQSGYYYYAPSAVPFLSKEQKVELLRICSSDDVECLQYHLRAAHGYAPSAGPLPSYAHLGCDPKKDPTCKPKLVQKTPSGHYLQYPNCDPRDPLCAYAASLVAPRTPNPPAPAGPGSCNPLFEEGCNPLTATRFATPPEAYRNEEKEEAAAIRVAPPAAEQNNDPYAMFRDTYANANRVTDPYAMYRQASAPTSPPANDPYANLRRFIAQAHVNDPYSPRMEAAPESNPNDPFSAIREAAAAMHHRGSPTQQHPFSYRNYEEPAQEERHPLGPPGKTKEGYDCYIGYDRECYPVKPNEPRSGVYRRIPYPAEAYEPHLNADGTRNGVLEPSNPHCDPEHDPDCRLRRYEPEQTHTEAQPKYYAEEDHSQGATESEQQLEQQEQDQYEAEPYQSGQEEPHMSYQPFSQGMPSLQDILRRYGDQYPEQDDHRAYADDYRKK